MKKGWLFIVLIIFEIVLGLAYGFVLQNIVPVEICLIIAFFVPLFIVSTSFKKQRDVYVKFIEVLALSLLSMAVFIAVFFGGNQLRGEFIGEYDVIVEFVDGRGGGYADFTTPQGNEGSVDLHDYRPIIVDDDYVDVGDTIRVREYKGLFNEIYYVFVAEVRQVNE